MPSVDFSTIELQVVRNKMAVALSTNTTLFQDFQVCDLSFSNYTVVGSGASSLEIKVVFNLPNRTATITPDYVASVVQQAIPSSVFDFEASVDSACALIDRVGSAMVYLSDADWNSINITNVSNADLLSSVQRVVTSFFTSSEFRLSKISTPVTVTLARGGLNATIMFDGCVDVDSAISAFSIKLQSNLGLAVALSQQGYRLWDYAPFPTQPPSPSPCPQAVVEPSFFTPQITLIFTGVGAFLVGVIITSIIARLMVKRKQDRKSTRAQDSSAEGERLLGAY